ncbi:hypothetical protein BKA93DRAFT_240485 [Sparassis latifolia]
MYVYHLVTTRESRRVFPRTAAGQADSDSLIRSGPSHRKSIRIRVSIKPDYFVYGYSSRTPLTACGAHSRAVNCITYIDPSGGACVCAAWTTNRRPGVYALPPCTPTSPLLAGDARKPAFGAFYMYHQPAVPGSPVVAPTRELGAFFTELVVGTMDKHVMTLRLGARWQGFHRRRRRLWSGASWSYYVLPLSTESPRRRTAALFWRGRLCAARYLMCFRRRRRIHWVVQRRGEDRLCGEFLRVFVVLPRTRWWFLPKPRGSSVGSYACASTWTRSIVRRCMA